MSSFSLVGVSSGVATLVSVDASGNLQCKDSALTTANHTDLVAIDAVLDASKLVLDAISASLSGTLAVSAGTISAVNTVVISGASVANMATENSSSVDITGSRSCSIFGNLTDTSGSIKVQVSLDNSNWIEKTDDYITMSSSGDFHKLVSSDVRYVRISYANSSGSAQTITANISVKS